MRHHVVAAALFAALLAPGQGRAETVQTCTGFITSLPAIISTQGVWCLQGDLATTITTGSAIEITTNNVTIDCNGFKVGGLGAGPDTNASGIRSDGRLNHTIRNCNVRGFLAGISINGGGGHQVLGNRLDGSRVRGIAVAGDGNLVQGNLVFDTGGAASSTFGVGIELSGLGHVIDNTVHGVLAGASVANGDAIGLSLPADAGSVIERNRISAVARRGLGGAYGIVLYGSNGVLLDRNSVANEVTQAGTGLDCGNTTSRARDNFVFGYSTAMSQCGDDGNIPP